MSTTDPQTNFEQDLEELNLMFKALSDDCEQFYASAHGDDQCKRRAYVRSVFAFIEGVNYRTKRITRTYADVSGNLTKNDLENLDEVSFRVDEKGESVSKNIYMPFLDNVKFAFKTFAKCFDTAFRLNLSTPGWEDLRKAVKVRDRLMHPKLVADLNVTETEVQEAKNAYHWFFFNYVLSRLHAFKAAQNKVNPEKPEPDKWDQKISSVEETLRELGL